MREMYKDGVYRVIHSAEEQAEFESKGWTVNKPPGPHVPYTATKFVPVAPKPAVVAEVVEPDHTKHRRGK